MTRAAWLVQVGGERGARGEGTRESALCRRFPELGARREGRRWRIPSRALAQRMTAAEVIVVARDGEAPR